MDVKPNIVCVHLCNSSYLTGTKGLLQQAGIDEGYAVAKRADSTLSQRDNNEKTTRKGTQKRMPLKQPHFYRMALANLDWRRFYRQKLPPTQ